LQQFALLKASQTVVLRAAYGPFLSSQTVTPASRLPLSAAADYYGSPAFSASNVSFNEPLPSSSVAQQQAGGGGGSGDFAVTSAGPSSASSPYLDLSAHLVTREVRKDQPVLRVVFHAGQSLRQHGAAARKKSVSGVGMCVVLSGQLSPNRTVEATCTPQGNRGRCTVYCEHM
jgi:hypothetical protein